MVRALLYLRLTSLKNSLLGRIKRLRQPKYLFGAIAGAAYFWLIFFRHLGGPARRSAPPMAAGGMPENFALAFAGTSPLVAAFGSLALFVMVVFTWILPSQKPGLGFTEAETAFLFPAPVSRRMLINFKLLSSQFTILLTSLFFTLISNRWSFLGGNALTHAIGWWIILSTLNLHFAAAALTLTRFFESGLSNLRRRLAIAGVIVLAVAATIAWSWQTLQAPSPREVAETGALTQYLLTVLGSGAVGWLLLPFRLVLGPFIAADTSGFLLALGPALLLLGAHYFWVLRLQEVSFEEATIGAAEKRSAALAQARAGQYRLGGEKAKARPGPFRLRDTGRPEIAFLWKNLLSTRPYFNLRTFGIVAASLLIAHRWLPQQGELGSVIATLGIGFSLFATGYLLLLGPHLARQDLRSDLANADVLKTYPLRGWQVVLGQLLTPVAILTGLTWLTLLAANLFFVPKGNLAESLTPALQTAFAAGLALTVPLLLALQLLVLNGATLIFPGWFQTTRGQAGGGIEVMGQRLIFMFGNLLVLFTALLPAAAAGLLIFATQWIIGGFAAIAIGTALVIAVLAGEVWCGIWWLGERFEKFDLSAELRP